MLTGMQMKAVFNKVMAHPAVAVAGARIAYLVGTTGPNGSIIAMGIWLPRIILYANDNRSR